MARRERQSPMLTNATMRVSAQLTGKTILITGAAGGFGREMMRQFLHAGCFLVLSDRLLPAIHSAASVVAQTFQTQRVAGRIIGYIAADLASREGCEQLHQQATALTPQIDILVNNAGIGVSGAFAAVPVDVWEQIMAVNLLAPMRLTALFLPAMLARRSGRIVNISSVAGLVGAAGLVPYATTKFGLRGFGEALAAELKPYGVGVTTLYPFFARTPILNAAHFGVTPPPALPDWMIGDPVHVIAALLAGIRADRHTVIPGSIAQQLDLLQRLAPGAPALLGKLTQSTTSRLTPEH